MIYTWSFVAFTIHVRKGPTLYTILPALPPTAWTSSAHSQDCFAHGTLVAMGLAVWATHGVIFSSAEKISILKKTPKFTACILKGGEKARAWVFSWKYLCWVPTKCFQGKKKNENENDLWMFLSGGCFVQFLLRPQVLKRGSCFFFLEI